MAQETPPPLNDFIAFARKKKKGHLSLWPKSGKPPLEVWFDTKAIPGEGARGTFHFQDKVLYLEGDGYSDAHVKGLQKTLKEDGWFTITVALDGDLIEVEGSEYDEVTDDWDEMKAVLDRHPLDVAVQRRYDRVEELIKQSPPKIAEIRKALRVLDPEVARLKTMRGGHGKTAEIGERRVNDQAKIARIRTAWARMERDVRAAPMTRETREDLALMEKLIASKAPDEKALVATMERLTDFVAAARDRARSSGAAAGDAKARAVKLLLAEWQKRIAPDLARIIAFRVKTRGEGAAEANKLMALGKQFAPSLQGDSPDIDRAKKTFAFFARAKTEMVAATDNPAGQG